MMTLYFVLISAIKLKMSLRHVRMVHCTFWKSPLNIFFFRYPTTKVDQWKYYFSVFGDFPYYFPHSTAHSWRLTDVLRSCSVIMSREAPVMISYWKTIFFSLRCSLSLYMYVHISPQTPKSSGLAFYITIYTKLNTYIQVFVHHYHNSYDKLQ